MTPEAELELRARRLEKKTLVRVSYQRAERIDEREHAVLHAAMLELSSGENIVIGTDDAFGAHHGFGISIQEKKRLDPAFGEVTGVNESSAWRALVGKSIDAARVRWGNVRDDLRGSLSIGVSIHADYLRRMDYPSALEIDIADTSGGARVTFMAARRGEDDKLIPFVNALLVLF